MKSSILFLLLLAVIPCSGQHKFRLTDPSDKVTVNIDVAECDTDCHGRATFSFTRKGDSKPFQVVRLPDTQIWLGDEGKPQANVTLLYDQQSAVNFDDFNFDGHEDVAICDGNEGGYGSPTYRVYLYSKRVNKYVYAPAFSKISRDDSLGMFEVDKKKKMLMRSSKDGCCWHRTEGFAVLGGQPKKIYEFTEDASKGGGDIVEIKTRRLVNGKWRTTIKHAKTAEYYKN